MQKLLFKLFFPTGELQRILEFEPEFIRASTINNLNILFIITIFLQISETVLLILPEQAFSYHGTIRLFLIVNVVLLSILYYIKSNYSKVTTRFLGFLQLAIVFNILFLATNLNLSSVGTTDYIHPIIIGLTFIATGLQFSSLTLTLIILMTGIINLVALYLILGYTEVFFVTCSNVSIFILIAWILGIMVSRTRVQSWLNSREILKQNEILDDLTKRDSMTRFYNHESIIGHLGQEILVSNLTTLPLCVLILDVDDFKKINDTHGHLKGDEILLMIAKHINMSVRVSDIIGRYGGEEFLLIFPNTDMDSAKSISERIRLSIMEAGIETKVDVTISGGLALYTDGSTDDIIRRADQRLYMAKRNGKNKIIYE